METDEVCSTALTSSLIILFIIIIIINVNYLYLSMSFLFVLQAVTLFLPLMKYSGSRAYINKVYYFVNK